MKRSLASWVGLGLVAWSLALVAPDPTLAVELNTGDIVVTDTSDDTLWHADPTTGTKTLVSVGGLGSQVAMALDGRIYAIDGGTDEVVRIDPASGDQTVVVGGFNLASDLAVAPGGDVVVVDRDDKKLLRVDPDAGSVSLIRDFAGDLVEPRGVAVEDDGDIIMVGRHGVAEVVWRIDPISGDDEQIAFEVLCNIGCITLLVDVAIAPDGGILVLDLDDGVFRVDPLTGEFVLMGVLGAGRMDAVAVESDGDILFTHHSFIDSDFSGVYRIDPERPGVEEKIVGFENPYGIAVVPVLDRNPPSVFVGTPADGAAYQPGETVIANYVCFDGGSGIHSCEGTVPDGEPIDTSLLFLSKQFTVIATDNAGNVTTVTHDYTIDGLAPSITITTPPEGAVYDQGEVVFADYACDDGRLGSGVVFCSSENPGEFDLVPTATVGPHTFTVTATDRAGNVSTLTHNYSVAGNHPPLAADLSIATLEDTAVAVTLTGSDPAGDPLTFVVGTAPAHGQLSGATPNLTYTPAANFNGLDDFTFTVNDGAGGSDTGSVFISVTAVNDAPSFAGPNVSVAEDSGDYAAAWATNVSAGPPDEVGQALAFDVTGNTNPALFSSASAVASDGSLSFTPAPNAYGTATLTVVLRDDGGTANDGQDTSAPWSFEITVTPVNDLPTVEVVGGECLSNIAASARLDLVVSDVESAPASLILSASSDNPFLLPTSNLATGGAGSQRSVRLTAVSGRIGTAVVAVAVSDGMDTTTMTISVSVGSDADDTLSGTSGADIVFGLAGNDMLSGGDGNDLLCGGNGADTLFGDDGADVLDGGRADDVLDGGRGNDRLYGGDGSDTLTGGIGADVFSGGRGADTAVDFSPSEGDTLAGSVP